MTGSASPRKKRRNLQSERKARVHQLYASDDVIKLYEISRNTLTNWIAEGLRFIDGDLRLFRGKDLNAFHARRRERASGAPLAPFMVNCFGCKGSHSLINDEISIYPGRTLGVFRASITCPDTGVTANRYVCSEEVDTIRKLREANPGRQTRD
ncbi:MULTISPECIES: hypothetical protein [unclassified Rhizobium]|uniref:hypothetical protein n=1 Tax=unclassified Rhizobium TaxID=2613769 RepID=UPI001785D78E|nr:MULTISPECIES: hypothetical protein [unclassified Rhizobium]MBD8689365.1 hypothetical protein [Rhizobium sp. CFBP 13644]MBD8693876.1 hypothetical protein [Rhizobium sp. CFBP 13717]